MSQALTVPAAERSGRGTLVGLGLVAAVGLVFVFDAALPYFSVTEAQFRWYWPRRYWLLLHVVTGIAALVSGPVQLWLGLARRRLGLHRALGVVYLASVGTSAMAAYYLALQTDFGWGFGAGLAGLATAWLVTTGLAFVAIRLRLYDQHKEWMVRSYVTTTAFITFRALFTVLNATAVGTPTERLTVCSWFCWAIPLLVCEAVLQGRKLTRGALEAG
jgi:uncharacterized membrane protein